jgi:hypothetical protein
LLERHLAAFETTGDLAATTRLLAFGACAGGLATLAANAAADATLGLGGSW